MQLSASPATEKVSVPAGATVGTTIVATHDIVVAGLTQMLDAPAARRFRIIEPGSSERPAIVLYGVDAATPVGTHDVRLHALLRSTRSKVIATYWEDGSPAVEAALRCGVHGALSLKLPSLDFCQAMEKVLGGVSGDAPSGSAGQPCDHDVARAGLTPRELEVLALIAEGLTNQELAERLFVSINTVKTYVRTAYRKIGVERRSQAVLWTMLHGVSTPEWLQQPSTDLTEAPLSELDPPSSRLP